MSRSQIDDATRAEGWSAIERGVRSQVRLIDELLDVNRITSGKFGISTVDVDISLVLHAALQTVMPDAHDKRITLRSTGSAKNVLVRGDATRLQQVLWNLLTNAVKFTPPDGEVHVRLERREDHIVITVSDSGQGIDKEFLPHVFERFRQADSSTTRHHGGLGLGLAITRHIVELHGGAISVSSEGAGRGAQFTVALPCMSALAPKPAPQTTDLSSEISLHGVRALIVDDDGATRDIVARSLSQCGADTQTSRSADEALAALEAWRPSVLICDIGMPGKNGYTFIRELRARPGDEIPAVALTAYTREEDRARALEAGYNLHIPKPINMDDLIHAVWQLTSAQTPCIEQGLQAAQPNA
jgi:CheY-like chemotaxis protein